MATVNKVKEKKKSSWIAYFCWLIGGLFGLHLFYLRRDRHAFLHWLTIGGCFGCGWLRDFVSIRTYVANANSDSKYVQHIAQQMKKRPKPPFSLVHFTVQGCLGYLLGLLYWHGIPREAIGQAEYDITWLQCLTPIAVALGVHTYGNVGHEKGGLAVPLVSSFITAAFVYLFLEEMDCRVLLGWTSFVAAAAFTWKCRQWRQIGEVDDRGFVRRVAVLSVCCSIVLALCTSGLYYNCVINTQLGEKMKFRDAVMTFLNRELFEQVIRGFNDFNNFYNAHGWEKVFDDVYDNLSSSHDDKARKILGVPSNASKEKIVSRWRTLSKEWHPDRHRDPKKKADAQAKFMEFQAAYQTLVKIRGKFKAAKDPKSGDNEL